MSDRQTPNGRRSVPEQFPLLDVATFVGGGMLSAAGLLRGGIRGWISTSVGTLLLYRGLVALQAHAVGARSSPALTGAGTQRLPSSPEGANPEFTSLPMKGTCISPGIVAPI